MNMLNTTFNMIDAILKKYNIYKVETIGDSYIAVSGMFEENDEGNFVPLTTRCLQEEAENIFKFACELVKIGYSYIIPNTTERIEFRVGLHVGDVTSGVISNHMPRFQLFGETMNFASRMESSALPLHINVSDTFLSHLDKNIQKLFRSSIVDIKGYGLITSYMYQVEDIEKTHKSSPQHTDIFSHRLKHLIEQANLSKDNLITLSNI
jgi:class 3 adenylate cyclase